MPSASITSSKARMPAWMQASQEEDDLAMNEDDEFLELERQAAKMAEDDEFRRNDVFNTGFAAPESIGKLRKNIPTSFAGGASSKGSKKVPAWMSAGNEEEIDILDNTLQLNDTQLAVAEMSSKGSRQESTPKAEHTHRKRNRAAARHWKGCTCRSHLRQQRVRRQA